VRGACRAREAATHSPVAPARPSAYDPRRQPGRRRIKHAGPCIATKQHSSNGPDNTGITSDTETQDDRRPHLSQHGLSTRAAAPSFREPLGSTGSSRCYPATRTYKSHAACHAWQACRNVAQRCHLGVKRTYRQHSRLARGPEMPDDSRASGRQPGT